MWRMFSKTATNSCRCSATDERGMTTQTIVLISICVIIAVAAGLVVWRTVLNSGEQTEAVLAPANTPFKESCELPKHDREGFVVPLDGFFDLTADRVLSGFGEFVAHRGVWGVFAAVGQRSGPWFGFEF